MIALDKQAHVLAGAVIALAVAAVAGPVWGGIAGIMAGVAKEAFDRLTGRGVPDVWDAVATDAGAIAGAAWAHAAPWLTV